MIFNGPRRKTSLHRDLAERHRVPGIDVALDVARVHHDEPEERRPLVRSLPAADQGEEALRPGRLRRRQTEDVEHGGEDVRERDDPRDRRTRGQRRRQAEQHRDAHDLLVERLAVSELPVLEELLPVVGDDEHERRPREAGGVERAQDRADVRVDPRDLALVERLHMLQSRSLIARMNPPGWSGSGAPTHAPVRHPSPVADPVYSGSKRVSYGGGGT
jgi:hypothetical protein